MPKAIIIYETRKGSTQKIAETIQESIIQSGVDVVLKRISEVELPEIDECTAVILGSPTYNKDMAGSMKAFLSRLEKINLKNKVGASFGAYGWSGEAVELISENMKKVHGMNLVEPGVKLAGSAEGVNKVQYQDFAKRIVDKMNAT